jgi:hypothetical protein
MRHPTITSRDSISSAMGRHSCKRTGRRPGRTQPRSAHRTPLLRRMLSRPRRRISPWCPSTSSSTTRPSGGGPSARSVAHLESVVEVMERMLQLLSQTMVSACRHKRLDGTFALRVFLVRSCWYLIKVQAGSWRSRSSVASVYRSVARLKKMHRHAIRTSRPAVSLDYSPESMLCIRGRDPFRSSP